MLPHPEGRQLGRGGASNNVPNDDRLHLLVLVSNTGAHGGVLEKVEFARFRYLGEMPQLWSGIGKAALQTGPHWSPYNDTETDVPLALEAGEVETRWLAGRWLSGDDETEYDSAQAPVLVYAEKLRGLRGIEVDIEWTYRRVEGGWRSLIPGKTGRRRETVVESTTIKLDGAPWIEACRAVWGTYRPPINVLEGRHHDDDDETSNG